MSTSTGTAPAGEPKERSGWQRFTSWTGEFLKENGGQIIMGAVSIVIAILTRKPPRGK